MKSLFQTKDGGKKNDMKEKTQRNEKIWGDDSLQKEYEPKPFLFVGDHASLNVKAVLQYYI